MKKILTFAAVSLLLTSISFAETTTNSISNAMEDVIGVITETLPENSSLLSNQPDAYIGNLFPSIPPHLTAGLSFAATMIKTDTFTDAVNTLQEGIKETLNSHGAASDFNINCDLMSKLPVPTAAAAVRIGGLVLPLDMGAYAISTFKGMIKDLDYDDFSADLDYTSLGFDVRYEVYEGKLLLPKVSVGAGYLYNYFNMSFNMNQKYSFNSTYASANSYSENANLDADINFESKMHTLFASIQLSKKFLIFEPYIGLKGFMTKTENDYKWSYKTSSNGTQISELSDDAKKSYTKEFGNNMTAQVFGGLGLQLLNFQIALNGAYNFTTCNWSAGLGLNFKL